MKSVISGEGGPRAFPKLMMSNDGHTVVLFNEPGSGTIVFERNPCGSMKVGNHSTGWAMVVFTEFNGEVTLSN